MKKLIFAMCALALTATTFVSCEDVPAPYDLPTNGGTTGGDDQGDDDTPTAEATGSGTLADPYNFAAANQVAGALADNGTTDDYVYVKGIVSYVKEEYSTNFGNGTFYISDTGTDYDSDKKDTQQFYIYRALYLGNKKFADGDTQIKQGDEVVVCAKLTKYVSSYGTTLETVQGSCYLYSLNGKTASGGSDTPSTGGATGKGTAADPYNYVAATNVASALEQGQTTDDTYYIKGKISKITYTFSAQFGTSRFYITDDGKEADKQFLVYSCKYFDNAKWADGNQQINVGDDVVVCAKLMNYSGTLETSGAYLVSLNGKTSDGSSEPSTPATVSLISNGDFETWADGLPTGWKTSSTAGNATLTQSTDAHGGSYSVSVGYAASYNKRLGYKEITLKPGTYTFSFYAKNTTDNNTQCRPGYAIVVNGTIDNSTGYKYGSYASLSGKAWTLVTNEFTLTEATTVCLLVMNSKTNATYGVTAQDILIDDAILTTTDGGVAQ